MSSPTDAALAARIAALRAQCGGPRDGALLRCMLGQTLAGAGDHAAAITEFERALDFDARYSAAWKFLGRALLDAGRRDDAANAWRQGIAAAEAQGDVQAAKQMRVFVKRVARDAGQDASN
jgi:tetratricopeptide (TPR) repeat protein